MSDKARTQATRAVLKHFNTLVDDQYGTLKFHTKTINKTQMKVLSRLDVENVDLKRSDTGITVIMN